MFSARSALKTVSGNRIRLFSTTRALRSELSYQVWGPEGDQVSRNPIIFLHGLFGSKSNNRSISRVLARDLKCQIYTLDLRNHGHSFHAPEHNYTVMANDVQKFIHDKKLGKCVLMGHSMGAKTAMVVALQSPDLVSALIPIDNAPVNAPLRSDFPKYVRGMEEVDRLKVTKSSDADKILSNYEESLPIRQFLLTNMIRSPESHTLTWRIPLSILSRSLDAMADFPWHEPGEVTYLGPTLFIRGTNSKYVSDDTIPAIKKFFPNSKIADVKSGHWVTSENPEAFRQAVVGFLKEVS